MTIRISMNLGTGSRREIFIVLHRHPVDLKLENCFAQVTSARYAHANYLGARLLGSPHSGMAFRWGYGWPKGRGYAPITEEEREWIQKKRAQFPCHQEIGKLVLDPTEVNTICR